MNDFEHTVQTLFEKCLQLPREEWESFLESSCPNELELRENVLSLLHSHESTGGFLDMLKETDPGITITELGTGPDSEALLPKERSSSRRFLWLTLLIGVFAILAFYSYNRNSDQASIAVIPFGIITDADEDLALVEGIHSQLITELSSQEFLRVLSIKKTIRYLNTSKTGREIGQELGVHYLLVGDIQRYGSQVRINAQLINSKDDQNLWSLDFHREYTSDISWYIQQEVSSKVFNQVAQFLNFEPDLNVEKVLSYSPEALAAYSKGMEILHVDSNTYIPDAMEHFKVAISLDPNFAMAHLGLGECYIEYNNATSPFISKEDRLVEMKKAYEKVLTLDDRLPQLYILLGQIKEWEDDRYGEKAAYEKAIELDPEFARSYADLAEWEEEGVGLLSDPSYEEVVQRRIELSEKAVELAPSRGVYRVTFADALISAERFPEALEQLRLAVRNDPEFVGGHSNLANHLVRYENKIDEAMAPLRKVLALDPLDMDATGNIRDLYALLGDYERAEYWTWRMMRINKDQVDVYEPDYDWYRGERELALQGYRDYLSKPQDSTPHKMRMRLLNHDLRNGLFQEARARYYFGFLKLFNSEPTIETHFDAIIAMDVAAILKHTDEEELANRLVEKAWAKLNDTTSGLPKAYWEIVYLVLKEELEEALQIFQAAVRDGLYYRLEIEGVLLDPLRSEPEFIASVEAFESRMEEQLANIRRNELEGKFEPIPELPAELLEAKEEDRNNK